MHDRSHTAAGKWIKGTRWSLLKSPEKQTLDQLAKLGEVQQANKPLYRAFLLKEELRLLYQLEDPGLAPAHLDAWLTWASDPGSTRSSSSPAPSAATATGSSTRSDSASTTDGSRVSTAASA